MGVFSSIKNAIFGKDEDDKAKTTGGVAPTPAPTPKPTIAAGMQNMQAEAVDVEAQLAAKPGADKLNWRTSIVDLLKLLGIDSSYENRKELAGELGRSDYSGSADDNIWLHKATMRELQKNGGKVPVDMLD